MLLDKGSVIEDIELNIKWIRDNPSHQFPGWGNTVSAMCDAMQLLKEQEHKDRMFHALEDDWKRLKGLLKEQEAAYQGAEELLRQKTILFDDAIKRLKEQEAVEPKTGHWIWLQYCANEGVYCSECHTKMFDRYPMKKKLSQFCGHCGAKMDDEVEGR